MGRQHPHSACCAHLCCVTLQHGIDVIAAVAAAAASATPVFAAAPGPGRNAPQHCCRQYRWAPWHQASAAEGTWQVRGARVVPAALSIGLHTSHALCCGVRT